MIDNSGLLWISTDAGVCTFNGNTFKTYSKADGLPSLDIIGITADGSGRIWFKSFNGKPSFYLNGTIYNETNFPSLRDFRTRDISESFAPFQEGIWLRGDSSILFIGDTTEKKVKIKEPENSRFDLNVSHIYKIKEDTVLYVGRNGIFKKTGPEVIYERCWQAGTAHDIIKVGDVVYMIRKNGIYRFHKGQEELIYKAKPDDHLENKYLLPESKEQLWVRDVSNRDLFYLDTIDDPSSLQLFLSGYQTGHVINDNEGNIWLATQEDGLFFFPKYGIVNEYSEDTLSLFSCSYDPATGSLYVGMNNGTIRHLFDGSVTSYKVDCIYRPAINRVRDIIAGNKTWFSSNCFVGHIDQNKVKPILTYKHEIKVIGSPKNAKLFGSYFYVAGSAGVFRYDVDNKTHPEHLFTNRSFDVCFDNNGELLIADMEGVFKFPNLDDRVIRLDSNTLPHNIAFMKEFLIVVTSDNGIYLKSPDTLFHLTDATGLLSNFGKDILIQDDSTFWYGSKGGLNKIQFSRATKEFSTLSFTKHEGLISNEIEDLEFADDKVLCVSKKGIVSIPKQTLAESTRTIPLFFTGAYLNEQPIDFQHPIKLSHNHKTLKITFTAISYISGSRIKYYYRLKGFESEWIESKESELLLHTLPFGHYDVEVMAKGINGNKVANPISLKLIIANPYWQKTWFILLVSILFLLIVLGASALMINRIKKQEQAKTKLNSQMAMLKLKALQAQMNPHFTFNALGAIQSFALKNEKKQLNKYLVRFAKLIRLTLDASRASQISLADEIHLLTSYIELEQQRLDNCFQYSIHIDENINIRSDHIPPLFIQPLVENAIKHGLSRPTDQLGILKISFRKLNEGLQVTIKDNGIGLEASAQYHTKEHTSHSTNIIHDRIKNYCLLYNFNIRIKYIDGGSIHSKGTCVELLLPLIFDDNDKGHIG